MTDVATVEAIEEILEFIQEVKFGAGSLSVQRDTVNNAQVYYVVLTVIDSKGVNHAQRVATVYASTTNPPTYNAEFVSEMFAAMADLIPELGEHILDSLDAEEETSRKLSVAGFLADQIYSLTMSISNNNEKLKQAWQPLLSILNIEPNVLEEMLPMRMTQTVQAVPKEPQETPILVGLVSVDNAGKELPVNVETTETEQEPPDAIVEKAAE